MLDTLDGDAITSSLTVRSLVLTPSRRLDSYETPSQLVKRYNQVSTIALLDQHL